MNNILYKQDELKKAFVTFNKFKNSNEYKGLNLKEDIANIKLEDFFIVDNNYINNEDQFYIKSILKPKLKNLDYFIAYNNYSGEDNLLNQLENDLTRTEKFIYQNNKLIDNPKLDPVDKTNNINIFNTFFLNQPVFKTLDISQQYINILKIDIITTQQILNLMHSISSQFLKSKKAIFGRPEVDSIVFEKYKSKKYPEQYIEYFLTDNNIVVVANYNAKIINADDDLNICGGVKLKLIVDLINNTYSYDLYIEYNKNCKYDINNLENAINDNPFKLNYFTKNLDRATCIGCGVGTTALLGTLFLTGVLGGKSYKNKNSKIKNKKSKNKNSKIKNKKSKNKNSKIKNKNSKTKKSTQKTMITNKK